MHDKARSSRNDESGQTERRPKRADRKGRRAMQAQEDESAPSSTPESPSGNEAAVEPPSEPQPSSPAPATGELPMSGVRVIDVGNFLAGPYAASIMGEFGAEVLKMEHSIAGDPMRRFGTPRQASQRHPRVASEARNKKSVTIDLRQKRGSSCSCG
jgi:succinyl-CoA:(S)-malate CoA-transferase subunit A